MFQGSSTLTSLRPARSLSLLTRVRTNWLTRRAVDWFLSCSVTSPAEHVLAQTRILVSAVSTGRAMCTNTCKALNAKQRVTMDSLPTAPSPVSIAPRLVSLARCRTKIFASTATFPPNFRITTRATRRAIRSVPRARTETAPCFNAQTALLLARPALADWQINVDHVYNQLQLSTY